MTSASGFCARVCYVRKAGLRRGFGGSSLLGGDPQKYKWGSRECVIRRNKSQWRVWYWPASHVRNWGSTIWATWKCVEASSESSTKAAVLKCEPAVASLGGACQHQWSGSIPSSFSPLGRSGEPRVCIPNKFPGDTEVASQRPHSEDHCTERWEAGTWRTLTCSLVTEMLHCSTITSTDIFPGWSTAGEANLSSTYASFQVEQKRNRSSAAGSNCLSQELMNPGLSIVSSLLSLPHCCCFVTIISLQCEGYSLKVMGGEISRWKTPSAWGW